MQKDYNEDGITNEIIKCCSAIVETNIAIVLSECFKRHIRGVSKLQKFFLYTKRGIKQIHQTTDQ